MISGSAIDDVEWKEGDRKGLLESDVGDCAKRTLGRATFSVEYLICAWKLRY